MIMIMMVMMVMMMLYMMIMFMLMLEILLNLICINIGIPNLIQSNSIIFFILSHGFIDIRTIG